MTLPQKTQGRGCRFAEVVQFVQRFGQQLLFCAMGTPSVDIEEQVLIRR